MLRHLFIGLCVFTVSAWGHVRQRPRNGLELGASYLQVAEVVPCRIAWIDYSRMRRDYAFLREKSEAEIDAIVKRSFCLVTRLQRRLEGTLLTEIPAGLEQVYVFHPQSYRRASMATFFLEEEGEELLGEGLIDLKGTGLSPEHEAQAQSYLAFYKALRGDYQDLMMFGAGAMHQWREDYQEAQADLAALSEKLRTESSAEERRRLRYKISNATSLVGIFDIFFPVFDRMVSGEITRDDEAAQRLLIELRKKDYLNGSAALSRVHKEIAMQRGAQQLFEENKRNGGLGFETVEAYFSLELPYSIIGPDGRLRRAGILGRQPTWRMSRVVYPESILGRKLYNSIHLPLQSVVGGGIVDFETNASDDPRIASWAKWDDARGQAIDQMAEDATEKFIRGQDRAIYDLLETTGAPLAEFSESTTLLRPNTRNTPADEIFSAIVNPEVSDEKILQLFQLNLQHRDTQAAVGAIIPRIAIVRSHLSRAVATLIAQSPQLSPGTQSALISDLLFTLRMGNNRADSTKFPRAANQVQEHLSRDNPTLWFRVLDRLLRHITISKAAINNFDIKGFTEGNPVASEMSQMQVFMALANTEQVRRRGLRLNINRGLILPGESNSLQSVLTQQLADLPEPIHQLIIQSVETATGRKLAPEIVLAVKGNIFCGDQVAAAGPRPIIVTGE